MSGRTEFCGTGANRGKRRGGITGGVSESRCLRKEFPCGPFENSLEAETPGACEGAGLSQIGEPGRDVMKPEES